MVDAGVTGHYAGEIEEMQALLPATLALDRRRVRERAEERFSHRRMVEEYVEVYRKVSTN